MAEDALGMMGFRFIRDEDGNLVRNPDFVMNTPRGPIDRNDIGGDGWGLGPRLRNNDREDRRPVREDPVDDPIDIATMSEGFDFIF